MAMRKPRRTATNSGRGGGETTMGVYPCAGSDFLA